jgi:hypothetical protein
VASLLRRWAPRSAGLPSVRGLPLVLSSVRWCAVAVVCAAGMLLGCVSTEAQVRVAARAGSLREQAVLPAPPQALSLMVGQDAMTDDEVRKAQEVLTARIGARLAQWDKSPLTPAPTVRVGRLEVLRAVAKVALGRDMVRHHAQCRVRILVEQDVVADVQGDLHRVVVVRNRSALELQGVMRDMRDRGGRNPLIDAIDVTEAVGAACDVAVAAATFDVRPEDVQAEEDAVAFLSTGVSPSVLAAQALRRAQASQRKVRAEAVLRDRTEEKATVAALMDLVEVGTNDDVELVRPFFHAPEERVRRAARAALLALCAGHAALAPESKAHCEEASAEALSPLSSSSSSSSQLPSSTSMPSDPSVPPSPPRPVRPVAGEDDEDNGEQDTEPQGGAARHESLLKDTKEASHASPLQVEGGVETDTAP